jgi:16S rRNA (cytosine967-C5)-methyltransferase
MSDAAPGAGPRGPGRRKDPLDAREVALEALVRLETTGAYPKAVLNARLGSGALSDADRDLARELVRGTVVWRGRIDRILGRFLDRPLETLPAALRNILRLGACQILFLDRIPAYAAVSESVRMARRHGHAGTAGLANAVLRRVAGSGASPDPDAGTEPAGRLAALWSHPEWLARRWVARLGEEEAESLFRADNRVPPVVLRHNRLKGPLQHLLDRLRADGTPATPHPLCGGYLVAGEGRGLFRSKAFQEGWMTVQDVSAGMAVLLLDPQPGEAVLDLCAAPGGKSGFIAERMEDRGRVVALDRNARRLRDVTENLRRLGIRCVEVRATDALTADLEGGFDRVLVDAPCSGLGVLARRPDVRWRRRESDLRELPGVQARLLARGASLVRPGGVLVYSTCTTEPEENEEVVEAFLEGRPEFRTEPARDLLPAAVADRYVRTWPHRHDCDGSFAARLRRTV